ncbi:cytochrome P450 [Imleria badia]|nr:cytochrome P450 [Imleria badia]
MSNTASCSLLCLTVRVSRGGTDSILFKLNGPFGFLVVLFIGRRSLGSRASYPFPPGPPGLPWVGNVTGVNPDAPWLTYAEWAKTYGDLIYIRLLGKDILIINSEKVAKDLFENRSKIYSDRPHFIISEMCGTEFSSGLMQYGERWRLHRRFLHQTFRIDAAPRFLPYQHRRACHLLRRLIDGPEQLHDHVFEYTAAVIMNGTYDYDPASRKDELVDIAASVLDIVLPLFRPDISVIIGAFPWLLYLPSWFPGMSFKREMAVAREYSKQYVERPFVHSLKTGPSSSAAPSVVHDALRVMEEKGITPEESWMQALKEASATVFLAASETSSSVILTFFLMMMTHPAIQEKAQAQIDAVVGKDRLPTKDDRPLLPWIDAIFRETLRYSPTNPLSMPHAVMEDDVYEGYHIPKGAMILTNLWSMSHNESRFPNPNSFIPERFLNNDGSLKSNEMEQIAFGWGRRMCVGKHFADASVWGVMAKVLAVFKILKPVDENGVEIPVEPKFSSGVAVHPLPFNCRIVPRHPGMDANKLEQLIAASIP